METEEEELDPKKIKDQQIREAYAQGAERGYDEREEEIEDEQFGIEDKPSPREQSMTFWRWSEPETFKGANLPRRMVSSIGTTFYPKDYQPILEIYHQINRIIGWKASYFARLSEPERADNAPDKFLPWTREKWYKWQEGNEAFKENIRTQLSKMDIDSFSRRSEGGAFLKEVNAQRRFIERKKDGIVDGLVKR